MASKTIQMQDIHDLSELLHLIRTGTEVVLMDQGTFVWATSVGEIDSDSGNNLAVDGNGNLYLTGYFSGIAAFGTTTLTSKGRTDIFIAKFVE